ncbi:MAG: DUF1109 family protein [Leptospiraceae bacterium]|nr:DUF1109 family protein [Leptospiraceae bacterium]
MKTNELINNLASRCDPVRPVRITARQMVLALGLSLLWMMLGVALLAAAFPGFRKSVLELQGATAMLEWLLFLMLGLWAFFLARGTIFPGTDRPLFRWALFVAVVLGTVGLSLVSYWQWSHGNADPHAMSPGCSVVMIVFSLVPAFFFYRFLRRSVCLSFVSSITISFLSVAFLAGSGTAFVCPDNHAMHMLFSHVLPMAVGLVLAVALGYTLDRRNRNEFEHYFEDITKGKGSQGNLTKHSY